MKNFDTKKLSATKVFKAKRLLSAQKKGYNSLAVRSFKEDNWLTAVSQIAYLLKNEKPQVYAKIKEECKKKKDTKYWHLVGFTFSDIYDIIHKYDGTPFDQCERVELICREMLSKVIANSSEEYIKFKDEEYKKKVILPLLLGLADIRSEYDKQINAILDKAKEEIINKIISHYILSGYTLNMEELLSSVMLNKPPQKKKYATAAAKEWNNENITPLIKRLKRSENIFDELHNIINKFKRDSTTNGEFWGEEQRRKEEEKRKQAFYEQ
jgi:hypothetical protein